MPGVSISTAVRTGPVNAGVARGSTFFIVGETARGTTANAVAVSSLAEYEAAFGGYEANKYVYQQIRMFFEEGGSRAYVSRVADTSANPSAAAKASVALTAEPSAAAGITLTAVGEGTWANGASPTNGLSAKVTNAGASFSLEIFFGGTAESNRIFVASDLVSLSDALAAVNNSSVLSNYCTAALSTSASPTALLTTVASANFASGTNGTIAEIDFINALGRFGIDLGPGSVAIPGIADGTTDATLYDAIKAHCVANNRVGILSFANGVTASSAVAASQAYGSTDNSGHEYLAMYYPWVTVPYGSGTNLTIPPDGYVAAVRSRVQNRVGPWQPYAGSIAEARFINGLATAVSRTDGDTLDNARVNAIRVINNSVRIYGARSHSTNTVQWRFITHRDTMNFVVDACESALDPLIFSTINGRKTIYADIASVLKGVMEPIRLAGGLYEGFDSLGRRTDYGYTIKVDDSINPISQLETGLIKAELGVRVSSIGDKIQLTITKSNLTATLV